MRRRPLAGENRIERVRRRAVRLQLLEQFWSLFAILPLVGGVLAFIVGIPQMGWAISVVIVVNAVFDVVGRAAERGVLLLQERDEMVFAGTSVVAGAGTFVVAATGWGRSRWRRNSGCC